MPTLCRQIIADKVELVCDVRLTPISRKPGLSKSALSAGLRDVGVEYLHLPALGNPKWNRAGFGGETDDLSRAIEIYRELMVNSVPAQEALAEIRVRAHQKRIALLCFEADPARCHRSVILTHLLGGETSAAIWTAGRYISDSIESAQIALL